MRHFKFYIPGVSLILMAVLIIAVPEILIAIISMLIMTMGVFILYIGHGLRKSEIELRKMDGWYRSPGWHRYCFYR
jgi:multisubunit Na+/H+ antiporter MnhC subunit